MLAPRKKGNSVAGKIDGTQDAETAASYGECARIAGSINLCWGKK